MTTNTRANINRITAFLTEAAQQDDRRVSLHLFDGTTYNGRVEGIDGHYVTLISSNGLKTFISIPHHINTAHYL